MSTAILHRGFQSVLVCVAPEGVWFGCMPRGPCKMVLPPNFRTYPSVFDRLSAAFIDDFDDLGGVVMLGAGICALCTGLDHNLCSCRPWLARDPEPTLPYTLSGTQHRGTWHCVPLPGFSRCMLLIMNMTQSRQIYRCSLCHLRGLDWQHEPSDVHHV